MKRSTRRTSSYTSSEGTKSKRRSSGGAKRRAKGQDSNSSRRGKAQRDDKQSSTSRRSRAKQKEATRPSQKSGKHSHKSTREDGAKADSTLWIYGVHAVLAALEAKPHEVLRVRIVQDALSDFEKKYGYTNVAVERVGRKDILEVVGTYARHQGIAAEIRVPEPVWLDDVILDIGDEPAVVVILDGVEDPGNLGAIVRSAYAHGALCVISPTRHAAPVTALTYKTACGALSHTPVITVPNLAHAITKLKSKGFWVYGFDAEGQSSAEQTALDRKSVLIIGGENRALRRLTKEGCDVIVSIPMDVQDFSMNAAQSTSIALYEWARQMRAGSGG